MQLCKEDGSQATQTSLGVHPHCLAETNSYADNLLFVLLQNQSLTQRPSGSYPPVQKAAHMGTAALHMSHLAKHPTQDTPCLEDVSECH